MGSMIRSSGTVFFSLQYLNSRLGFNGLKYLYTVISVIDNSLPGNIKKEGIVDGQSAISPSLGGVHHHHMVRNSARFQQYWSHKKRG